MYIGELKKRITILAFAEVRDEYGGIEGNWQSIAKRWASVEPIGATETADNQQVKAIGTTKISMRYMAELTEKNRISFDGKIYEITGVIDEKSEHKTTIANCQELKDGI